MPFNLTACCLLKNWFYVWQKAQGSPVSWWAEHLPINLWSIYDLSSFDYAGKEVLSRMWTWRNELQCFLSSRWDRLLPSLETCFPREAFWTSFYSTVLPTRSSGHFPECLHLSLRPHSSLLFPSESLSEHTTCEHVCKTTLWRIWWIIKSHIAMEKVQNKWALNKINATKTPT